MELKAKRDKIVVKFSLEEKKIIELATSSTILPVLSGVSIESISNKAMLKVLFTIMETNESYGLLPCENRDFYLFLAYCVYSGDEISVFDVLKSLENLKVNDKCLKEDILQFNLFVSKLFLAIKEGKESFGSENYFNDGVYLSNWKD